MSIEENITLASLKAICRYGIINHKKEQLSARKYFDELKIKAADMTVHMETLSGGNQQKAVLSKWLMTKPRVLIMDEPTRGIDVGTKYEIYKIMVELARQGIAIIMISSAGIDFNVRQDHCSFGRQGIRRIAAGRCKSGKGNGACDQNGCIG